MICPRGGCGSANVEFLPHYWESLPGDSPLKVKYASPDEVDGRLRLALAAVAVLGVVLAAKGTVGPGLVALAVGIVGVWVVHGRIVLATQARSKWDRTQICLACTHQWVPK